MYGKNCQINYGMFNTTFHEEAGTRIKEVFNFCEPLIFDNQLIYKKNENFINKNILILGGGGSTLNYLPTLGKYDSIWSLNNFYMNDYIRDNIKVDLFSVGPEVNLQDQTLLDYLCKHNTIAAFELHQKWGRTFNNPETGQTPKELSDEVNAFYDNNRKTVFQTKFYSQLGGGVRLLIYAAHIGVNSIDFIGFDGPQAILDGNHAFESNKKRLPGAVKYLDRQQLISVFEQQYKFFWSYFRHNYPNTLTKSLDGNSIHNEL